MVKEVFVVVVCFLFFYCVENGLEWLRMDVGRLNSGLCSTPEENW